MKNKQDLSRRNFIRNSVMAGVSRAAFRCIAITCADTDILCR